MPGVAIGFIFLVTLAEIYLVVLHDPSCDTGNTTVGYIFAPGSTNKCSHEVSIILTHLLSCNKIIMIADTLSGILCQALEWGICGINSFCPYLYSLYESFLFTQVHINMIRFNLFLFLDEYISCIQITCFVSIP